MKHYQYILFDLDGTITDSEEGIIRSIKYCLSRYGITDHDPLLLRKFIGPPLVQSLALYYNFTPEEATKAVGYYREYFSEKGIYENRLYDGIEGLLKTLDDKGKINILATAKPTFFAKKIIDYFKIDPYFKHIVGSNMDGTRMDKSEIIAYIIDLLHVVPPDNLVMIGDRMSDMISAKNLGIDTIWVNYGYGDDKELKDSDPVHIAETVDDLYPILLSED